jgi:hypothetical protein
MAELNFGLLTPPGSQSIGNAFVTGMDQAAAARAQENQNALSQYTLSKARREDQVQTAINSAYQGAIGPDGTIDYGAVNRALAAGGAGAKIPEAEAARRKAIADEIDLQIKKGTLNAQPGVAARTFAQTEAAKLAGGKSAQDFRNQGLRDMANNPSDANIVANHEDAVLRGMMTQEESDAQTVKLLAIPLDQRRAIFAQAGAPAAAPQQPRQPNLATDLLIPGPNGTMVPNTPLVNVRAKLAREGRPPAQPPAPSTQTIADPTDPTKAIVVNTRTYAPGGGANSPGVIGYAPPSKTPENIREEELKTAYNTNRILNSAVQIGNILKKTPSASQPGGLEASAMALFGNAGVANLSRSGDRQIVAAAQSDIIDSLLYLATGAAYNKEQLVQQRQSYLPAFTDEPGTVAAKQDALRGLIDGAKVRSGRAWTPKMESAMRSLVGGAPASPPTPAPAAAAKPYSVSTPDGKTHSFDTPAALAAFKTAARLN